MYADYIDPYKPPTDLDINRFNAVLREKILKTASAKESLTISQPKPNNKSKVIPEDELFEYEPMF